MSKTELRTVLDRHGRRITEVIAPKNWREELAESTRRRKELNRQRANWQGKKIITNEKQEKQINDS